MKLVITIKDCQQAIKDWLYKQGFIVNPTEIVPSTHREGQYDEEDYVFDGFVVEDPENVQPEVK